MRKLKSYLDTSVISHIFADDTPDKMKASNAGTSFHKPLKNENEKKN